MDEAKPPTFEQPLSYEAMPASPVLGPRERGLAFTLRSAQGIFGPTVFLLGTYRLGEPYVQVYGSNLAAAALVVAIDVATGKAFGAAPVPHETAPVSLFMREGAGVESGGFQSLAVHSHFNVDLGAHLMLPPEAARYRVLVWLDELLAPPQVAELPASSLRPGPRVPASTPRGDPPSRPGVLELTLTPGPLGPRVLVTLPLESADKPPKPPPITVLAYAVRDRVLRQLQLELSEARRTTTGHQLEFELARLIARPVPPQRIFILASCGAFLSPVLSVPPERWEAVP